MRLRDGKRWILLACMIMLLPTSMHPGSARATALERLLIMPGPVIEDHADFEDDCKSCHAPLSDEQQAVLCVACHEDVGNDIADGRGYHGRLPPGEQNDCAACHTDHEGRDEQIVELDESTFDHALTDFVLRGAHESAECEGCHQQGEPHRQAETTCIGCHGADDPHDGQLGEACNDCHTESTWSEATFDHLATGFPLTGGHQGLMCSACHLKEDLAQVSRDCVGCHRSDDVHKGRNGPQCADCHGASNWSKITFDHLSVSSFPLDGGHAGLTCADCHSADDFEDLGDSTCHACHRDDDVHEGRSGTDCAGCHRTSSWEQVSFDHTVETGFALPAGHGSLECTACHVDKLTDELPHDCGTCHVDDDTHQGQLGALCEDCHGALSWTTQVRFDHDLVSFPLLGAHATTACADCHESGTFHDAGEACMACHQGDDHHHASLGTECDICHNPSDWRSWFFDHDGQTAFVLTGAHSGLECAACHTEPSGDEMSLAGDCKQCHDRDDPHLGRFGNDCSNCHTTASFARIREL